uniref:Uncharacterized protein n=1 Tax=viral metagenome TaxID=1070528 RepID=A0A6C0JA46_9ZZZZ
MSIIDEIELYLQQHLKKLPSTKIGFFEDNQIYEDSELSFCKSWNKLTNYEKLNRLMLFHKVMVGTYSLSKVSAISLQKLFYHSYENLYDDTVEYDSDTAKIINIKGLKKDIDNDEFYFEQYRKKPTGIKISSTPFSFNKFNVFKFIEKKNDQQAL